MFWAAVPKAAIYKNGDSLRAKHEIGPSVQGVISAPSGDAVRLEDGNEAKFGVLVAARADDAHHRRSLFRGEDIGHEFE